MQRLFFTLLALISAITQAPADSSAKNAPIPYLSWQDVKALYPPKRYPGDWDCPKLNDYPRKRELIKECEQDLKLSAEASPDPFRMSHRLPQGKLALISINKDPENRIIYFVFDYESDLVVDLCVVYYYDPAQDRFILKSTR